MKRLKDTWAVLRGHKRAAGKVPVTPAMMNQSVIMWRYVVNNEVLAGEPVPETLAWAISKQAEKDVYKFIVKRARELQA